MPQPTTAKTRPTDDGRTLSTRDRICLVALHIATPIWIGYGAVEKALEFNPLLLPPPILHGLRWFASSTAIDATAFLSGSLRFIIGAEIFIVLALLLSRRWARPISILTLALFCIILITAMVQAGLKDGLKEALTGSCGCFGEAGPPASVMLLVDAALLVAALLAPRRSTGAFAPVAGAAIVGVAAAILTPQPEIGAPVPSEPTAADAGSQATSTPASPANPALAGPWPGPPEKYDPNYFPKWAEWTGQPFRDQRLARAIEGPMPEDLERGDWLVTFSRTDCDECQKMYRTHFASPRAERVLKVTVPDARGKTLGMACAGCEERSLFHVRAGQPGKSPSYVFQTPTVVRLKDGIVVAVATDLDKPEEVAAVFGPAGAPTPGEAAAEAPTAAARETPNASPARTAWPGPPERLEPFYVAEFGNAVGKPFSDVKIARVIENRLPADFLEGRWIVIFFREDCDHCFQMMSTYFTGPLKVRTLSVAIPDADPNSAIGNACDSCVKLSLYKGPNYVIGTPVVVAIRDGIVECVVEAEQVDDLATLEACLKLDAP